MTNFLQAPNDHAFHYARVEDHPRWKWQTMSDYRIDLWRLFDIAVPGFKSEWVRCSNGILMIPAGYHWNGANWPAVDTPSIIRASCIHDALYQAITAQSVINVKSEADFVFYKICRNDGMWRFRAWYAYQAVKMFGNP